MHRTVTRLYPWNDRKPVEILSDDQITVKQAMNAVCEDDHYAARNRNAKGFAYLIGEKGVYVFERIY